MNGTPESLPPLSLIVPVFNEAAAISDLARRLEKLLPALAPGSEVLVVDDGSTDGCADELRALEESFPALRVLAHSWNLGYGAALKTGVREAKNDWIAISDADGTYPLQRLPALLARAVEENAAMVVGARRLRDQPALRRPAKRFLNAFASYLAGVHIPDLNSGLRVFRRADAERLARLMPQGFSYTSTLTMTLVGEGARVLFVPIPYRERRGASKIRPVRDTAGFLLLVCRLSLAFHPLKVFGPLSALLIALGVGLLVVRLLLADQPVALATTITLLVGGLQIFTVGLLADLINRRSGGL